MKRTALILLIAVLLVLCAGTAAFADASNGNYKTFYQRGLELYEYAMQPVPVALGYPKLTDAEIDELIASNDYRLVRDKISTVADCINYFTRAGFSEDVGSAFEYDWAKDTSGAQTLIRRGGTCGGLCNCFAYLLRDDYDHIYYVHIDEHAMVIIEEEGVFYLVNPVELQNPKKERKHTWCDIAADRTITFADSIQDLADTLYNSGLTKKVFIVDTGGDLLPVGLEKIDGQLVPCYPIGAEDSVTVYYGEEYHYAEPDFHFEDGGTSVIDCPDWRTGEYFVPDVMVTNANHPTHNWMQLFVFSELPTDVNNLRGEEQLIYSVNFFGETVTDYSVSVSEGSGASVDKIKNGKFILTAPPDNAFDLIIRYEGITAKFPCRGAWAEVHKDFNLLTPEGYERTTAQELDVAVGKETIYSIAFPGEHVKDYGIEVSDKTKGSVKKLDDGRIAVTALTGEPFYLTIEYDGLIARFECRGQSGDVTEENITEEVDFVLERDFRLVTSEGYERRIDQWFDFKVGQELVYGVERINTMVTDYSVEVSDTSKASVEKLEDGHFVLIPKESGVFFLTVKYEDIVARFEFRDESVVFGNDLRIVNDEGFGKSPKEKLDFKKGVGSVFNIMLLDEPLTGYDIKIRDESMADVEILEDGSFVITPKKSGTFVLRVTYKEDVEEYRCRSTFSFQNLWQALRNFFSSIFGG